MLQIPGQHYQIELKRRGTNPKVVRTNHLASLAKHPGENGNSLGNCIGYWQERHVFKGLTRFGPL